MLTLNVYMITLPYLELVAEYARHGRGGRTHNRSSVKVLGRYASSSLYDLVALTLQQEVALLYVTRRVQRHQASRRGNLREQ